MSLDIDWSLLTDHHALTIERFVNQKLGEAELPSYLHNLRVLHFELGDVGPELSIVDICDPFPEFYELDEEEIKSQAEKTAAPSVETPERTGSSLRGINPLLARHLEEASAHDQSNERQGSGSLRVPRRRSVSNNATFLATSSGTASLSASPEVARRRRRSSVASQTDQALRERRSSMNMSSSGSLALSSSPQRSRPRLSALTQATSPQATPQRSQTTDAAIQNLSLEDLETSSSASGPPPYDHPMHGARGMSAWEGVNVPYFHSAFADPQAGFVSASGISTPAVLTNETQQRGPPVPSRRNSRMMFGPGMGHYFHGLGGVPERMASFGSNARDTTLQSSTAKPTLAASEEDVQLQVKLIYKGNLKLIIAVDLALNYPSPFFVTLPLELTLTELHIETAAAIAYMAPRSEVESEEAVRKVHFCLVEEEDEQDASTTNRANGYKEVDDNAKMNPLRGFHIESKIGNASCEQEDAADAVKDVEKVEKLMLKLIRELLEKEICFPSYYTFIL